MPDFVMHDKTREQNIAQHKYKKARIFQRK